MQYVPCRKRMGTGCAHLTGGAAHAGAELRQTLALGQQAGAGRTMDRAVDTAATEQ
ncbi:hypothetical protein D3C73_1024410 [compost metagenome]